jgi:hypothetical protein
MQHAAITAMSDWIVQQKQSARADPAGPDAADIRAIVRLFTVLGITTKQYSYLRKHALARVDGALENLKHSLDSFNWEKFMCIDEHRPFIYAPGDGAIQKGLKHDGDIEFPIDDDDDDDHDHDHGALAVGFTFDDCIVEFYVVYCDGEGGTVHSTFRFHEFGTENETICQDDDALPDDYRKYINQYRDEVTNIYGNLSILICKRP